MKIVRFAGNDIVEWHALYADNGVLIATEKTKAGKREYFPLGAWKVSEARRMFSEARKAQKRGDE